MEGQILYQVLAPENSLVEISHLAAQVAEVPIAFVTYIDSDYHWLKAQVGMEHNPKLYVDFVKLVLSIPEYEEWGNDDEILTPSSVFNHHHHYLPSPSLTLSASYVVGKMLKIGDVLHHKKLQQHPLVKRQKPIRFYLAIPIITQGQRIGLLSLMDYRERPLEEPISQGCELALQRIAHQISSQIGLHHKLIDLAMQLIKIQEKSKEQEKVAETLNLLQRAIAASKNGIIITDATRPDNTIIYCNAAFEKITGYSQAEVLNRNCRFLQGPDTDPQAIQKIRQAIREEQDCLVVLKNYRRDGTPFWNELAISPVRDQHQRLINFIGIQTDISQRKQAEYALQESEERYRLLANHSTDLISRQTADGIYLYVSPACRYLLGYEPTELIGKSIVDLLHPEDRGTANWPTQLLNQSTYGQNGYSVSVHNQTGYTFSHRLKHQNGNYIWFETTGQILKKDNEQETGELVMVSRDITQRKETEALLLERSRLSMLEAEVGLALGQGGDLPDVLQRCTDSMVKELQVLAGGIWMMQQQTHHLQLLSFSSKKHISLADLQLDEAGNEENQISPYSNMDHPLIAEGQVVGIFRVWSEEVISYNSRDVLTNVANAIALFIHRQQKQEKLSSHRENLLFKIANQIRDSLDLDKILGTAVTEIRNLLDIDQCYFIWCLAAHTTSIIVTHEARRNNNISPTGEYPQDQISEIAEKIKNRQVLRLDHTVMADQPVSQSLINYFQTTGVKSQLLLPLQTRSAQLGAVVCCNYTSERAWSESEIELLQAVVDQIAIAIDQAELYAQTRAAALAAQTQAMQLNEALQNLQQKESQLIQQEKMSSLGQMVAGVAHEINNPVNFIYGNLSYCKDYFQDLLDLLQLYQKNYPEPVKEIEEKAEEIELDFLVEDLPKILSSMEIGTERIRQIVLSLRNFSRLDEAEMKPVDIHEGIDSTLLILHNKIKPKGQDIGLEIIKNYGNLPKVECYAGQLNQVFMNVISNAIDALENIPDPKITITTELSNGDSHAGQIEPSKAKYVLIKIKDNGPGMPEKVRTHLFDPFFTTKPVGKGTGLGLSISYQIVVDKHGGSFQCLSESGQGAEFSITIPIRPSGHR